MRRSLHILLLLSCACLLPMAALPSGIGHKGSSATDNDARHDTMESEPAPRLFAPGVMSGGANDGSPTISSDGRNLFFERTNSRWTGILESHRVANTWSKPVLASFSGTASDQQPAFAPDGTYLVYVSTRAAPNGGSGSVSHLYRVDRIPGGWSAPVELPPAVNISRRVFKPSIAANGDLYFMADSGSGGSPQWRLFVARHHDAGFAKAEPLPFSGIGDADVDPYISPDQSFLIFSSATRSELKDGKEHLFVVTRQGGGWSPVRPIRYTGDDWGGDDGEAQVGPDCLLYFMSSRVLPVPKPRTRQSATAAIDRMEIWDNSNNNVWTLPITYYLGSQPCSHGKNSVRLRE
ncbi:hypothetical protein ACVWZA_001419 [Sphingomonas sp. UYAg733]